MIQTHQPQNDGDDGDDVGENRPVNKKLGDHGAAFLSCPPGAGAGGCSGLRGRGLDRSHLFARDGREEAVGDDPLLVIQAFGDDGQVLDLGAEFDAPALDDVFVVHHQHVGAQLVEADGHGGNQQGGLVVGHRDAQLGEQPRQHHALGIGEDPPERQGAGGGVEADAGEIQVALVGIALLVGETEIQGNVLANDGAHRCLDILGDIQEVVLIDGEVDIEGVDLIDIGQEGGFAGAHQVAGVFQPAADAAVEGRGHLGVAQVEPGQVPLRLRGHDRGLGRIPLVEPVVHIRLGRGLLGHQLGEPGIFGLGMEEFGLLGENLRLRLLEFGFVGVLLDQKQQLPFFDPVAVFEVDLLQVALDPGLELHRVDGLGVAGEFQVIGHRLFHRLTDRDLGRRRRHVGVFFAAGGGYDQGRQDYQPGQGATARPWRRPSLPPSWFRAFPPLCMESNLISGPLLDMTGMTTPSFHPARRFVPLPIRGANQAALTLRGPAPPPPGPAGGPNWCAWPWSALISAGTKSCPSRISQPPPRAR